jgi:ubiquinone/menaquinone biosynthesis C-methylase UbiE
LTELAFSFGRIAVEYDDVRPEYAPEALARAEEALGLGAGSSVVDLAAGSGKLTRALAQRFGDVTAVEPNDEMRGVLAQRSAGIRVLAGTAERMPLPDSSADAVFVGDAFHWFDGAAAVDELARVLRPGGGVALLWNHWWSDGDDRTSNSLEPPLPAEAQELFDEVYVRSGRAEVRKAMADPLLVFSDERFEPLTDETFPRSEALSRREVVDLFATVSSVASLPTAEREELKRTLRELLEPSYRLRIITELHWTRRA